MKDFQSNNSINLIKGVNGKLIKTLAISFILFALIITGALVNLIPKSQANLTYETTQEVVDENVDLSAASTTFPTDWQSQLTNKGITPSNITSIKFTTTTPSGYTTSYGSFSSIYIYKKPSTNDVAFVYNGTIYAPSASGELFAYLSSLTSIEFTNFNTSYATAMYSMFRECSSLTSLDLSSFNTSKVDNMSNMFRDCSNLVSLDLSNFNTSSVLYMNHMFSNCTGLTSLDVSNFNTSTVEIMENMFHLCSSLTTLNLSNFNTSSVTRIGALFAGCIGLTTLNLSNFNTSKAEDMSYMFADCTGLTSLNVSNFNTSSAKYMNYMFTNCNKLPVIDLHSFDMTKVTSVEYMFSDCPALVKINAPKNVKVSISLPTGKTWYDLNNSNSTTTILPKNYSSSHTLITDSYKEFPSNWQSQINSISSISATNIYSIVFDSVIPTGFTSSHYAGNISTGINVYIKSSSTSGLYDVAFVSSYVIFAPQNSSYLFSNTNSSIRLTKLTSITFTNFDTSQVTNMTGMFDNCRGLTTLDVSNFNLANVTNMYAMFYECSRLKSLDVSFNTANVTYMDWMFYGCSSLTTIDVSNWDTSNVVTMACMFYGCNKLQSLDFTNWNTGKNTATNSMFRECDSLTSLDLSSFNTSKVDNMSNMFRDSPNLVSLDLSNFDTSANRYFDYMFAGCSKLETLNISSFNLSHSNVASDSDFTSMLRSSDSLKLINTPKYCPSSKVVLPTSTSWYNKSSGGYVSTYLPSSSGTSYILTIGNSILTFSKNDGNTTWANIFNSYLATHDSNCIYDPVNNVLKGANRSSRSNSYSYAKVQLYNGSSYYDQILTASTNGMHSVTFQKSSSHKILRIGFNGNVVDAIMSEDISSLSNDYYYTVSFKLSNFNSKTGGEISEIKLERTSPKTGYSFPQKMVGYGKTYGTLLTPVRAGYTFNGWYTAASGGTLVTSSSTVSSSSTELFLYAHWTQNNVTFPTTWQTEINSSTYINKNGISPISATAINSIVFDSAIPTGFTSSHYAGNLSTGINVYIKASSTSGLYDVAFVSGGIIKAPQNSSYLFSNSASANRLKKLTSITFTNFDTSSVSDMSWMFVFCSGLKSLDVSEWDVSNVENITGVFCSCRELTSLDVSKWSTGNIMLMGTMFYGCSNLTSLDVSEWDTSNAQNMSNMFYDCSELTSLNVSNFNTANVTTMSGMFYECNSLTSLDVSKWNTGNVIYMDNMFYNCYRLKSLDVSKWDTSNVTNMQSMFNECFGLKSLDVSNFKTSNVTNMREMFYDCYGLTSLDVSKWDTAKVTNMYSMFEFCSRLTSLDVSKWDTSKVEDMTYIFSGCSDLKTLDVSKWDTAKVINMGGMFSGCTGLASLDVSNFNTAKVINMGGMFSWTDLTSLDLSKWDTSSVTTMFDMFNNCSGLTTLDLSSFDMTKVTDASDMFTNCSALKYITLPTAINSSLTVTLPNNGTWYKTNGAVLTDSKLIAKTATITDAAIGYKVTANGNDTDANPATISSTSGWGIPSNKRTATKLVTYSLNYGILESPGSVTLPTATRSGYTFNGWYKEVAGTNFVGNAGASYTPTANITLYAKWTANTYNITINNNSGIGGAVNTNTYSTSTSEQERTLTNPTRVGYTFSGWTVSWTDSTHSSTLPTVSGTTLIIPANCYGHITLTANWTINSYTLTINPNGGSYGGKTTNTTVTQNYGTTYTVANPTRTGYAFAGWTLTRTTGTGSAYGSLSSTTYTFGAGNDTLTANWTINSYTLTINPNGGSYGGKTTNTTVTQNYGTTYTVANPTRTGYTFAGWTLTRTTGTGSAYGSLSSTTYTFGAGNDTLTANWTINSYTLTVVYQNFNGLNATNIVAVNATAGEVGRNSSYVVDSTKGFAKSSSKQFTLNYSTTAQSIEFYAVSSYCYRISVGSSSADAFDNGNYYTSTTLQSNNSNYSVVKYNWTPNANATIYVFVQEYFIIDHNGSLNGVTGDKHTIFCETVSLTGTYPKGTTFSLGEGWKAFPYKTVFTTSYTAKSGYKFSVKNGQTASTNPSDYLTSYTFATNKELTGTFGCNAAGSTLYSITFNSNGGSGTMANQTGLVYMANETVSANTFTRTGYTFSGWSLTSDGAVVVTNSGTINKTTLSTLTGTVDESITLYAQWTANIYKVTLDKQSGSGGIDAYWYKYKQGPPYYYSDSACTTPTDGGNGSVITVPTRTGYTFGGYFTNKNGSGTQYVNSSGGAINSIYTTAGNTTLYAKWTENIAKVDFGGSVTYFNTLESAFTYANGLDSTSSNNAVITLLKNYTATSAMTVNSGKYIKLKADSAVTLTRGMAGNLFVNNGTFTIGASTSDTNLTINGNNIGASLISNTATLTINNGTFLGNADSVATNGTGYNGGCVISTGTLTINNGTFKYFAAVNGGVIYSNATLNINGGVFGDGNATTIATTSSYANVATYGGAIFIKGGSATIGGSTKIWYNYATISDGKPAGGGIYTKVNTVITDNVSIKYNKSLGWGSAVVFCAGTSSINSSGVVISNNSANSWGAVATDSSTILNIEAGVIKDNSASVIKDLFVYNLSTCNISGGTINTICVGNIANLNIKGNATIQNIYSHTAWKNQKINIYSDFTLVNYISYQNKATSIENFGYVNVKGALSKTYPIVLTSDDATYFVNTTTPLVTYDDGLTANASNFTVSGYSIETGSTRNATLGSTAYAEKCLYVVGNLTASVGADGYHYKKNETYNSANDYTSYIQTTRVGAPKITANGTTATSVSVPYGTNVTYNAPAVTGYTFRGWYSSNTTFNSTTFVSSSNGYTFHLTETTTLYALYSINWYNVSLTQGTGISAVTGAGTYAYNTSITINATVKSGYTWSKWIQTSGGEQVTTTQNHTFNMPASNLSYTATATIITYTISYELNGGTVATANPTSYTVETETFTLNNPTKTGYTFAGWTGSNGSTAQTNVSIAKGSTGNKSYTANWTPEKRTINLVYWDSTGAVKTETASVDYDSTYNFDPQTRASDYIAYGWTKTPYTQITQTATADLTGATFSIKVTENATYYQVLKFSFIRSYYWDYTNTLWGNGYGENNAVTYYTTTTSNNTVVTGTHIFTINRTDSELGTAVSKPTGYTLAGWVEDWDNNSVNTPKNNFTKTVSNAQGGYNWRDGAIYGSCVFAVWQRDITQTVNYDANGHGTAPSSQSATATQYANLNLSFSTTPTVTIKIRGAISATGYTFNSWNSSQNGTGTSYEAGKDCTFNFTDSNDITLFAQWTQNDVELPRDWQSQINSTRYMTTKISPMSIETIKFRTSKTDDTYSLIGTLSTGIEVYANGNNVEFVWGAKIMAPQNSSYLFSNSTSSNRLTNLTSITFTNFNTSSVTNMEYMFYGCTGLTTLDVSEWDTENVKTMGYMFRDCTGLSALDVSKWDTGNVIYMTSIFENCSSLNSLNVSNFNTSSVTNMNYMFWGCTGLNSLDVSNFNTSSVTNMSGMFYECTGLTTLDISNFNTSSVENMSRMFWGCTGLTTLDVSEWDTNKVTNMRNMFDGCTGLTSLDVSKWDTSSVTDMRYMFSSCNGLTTLDVSNFNTINVTNMQGMFSNCTGLQVLDISSFDMTKVTNASDMFTYCSALKYITLPTAINSSLTVTLPNNGTWYKTDGSVLTDSKLIAKTSTITDAAIGYKVTANGNDTDANPAIITGSGWTIASDNRSAAIIVRYSVNSGGELINPSSITLPTATRTGYDLSGWYTEATSGTKVGDAGASYSPSADITIFAQWSAKAYNVKVYYYNASSEYTSKTFENALFGSTVVIEEADIGLPIISEHYPYKTIGFTKNALQTPTQTQSDITSSTGFISGKKFEVVVGAENAIYYQAFEFQLSIALYRYPNDQYGAEKGASQTFFTTLNDTLSTTSKIATGVSITTVVDNYKNSPLTYTDSNNCIWTLVGWNLNGGIIGDFNTSVTITDTSYSWTGNYETGSGWSFAKNVQSVWQREISYTISYNANGHSTAPSDTVVIKSQNANKLLTTKQVLSFDLTLANELTADGYNFIGWNTSQDGKGTTYSAGETVTFSNITEPTILTLFAMWEVSEYDITGNIYLNDEITIESGLEIKAKKEGDSTEVTLTSTATPLQYSKEYNLTIVQNDIYEVTSITYVYTSSESQQIQELTFTTENDIVNSKFTVQGAGEIKVDIRIKSYKVIVIFDYSEIEETSLLSNVLGANISTELIGETTQDGNIEYYVTYGSEINLDIMPATGFMIDVTIDGVQQSNNNIYNVAKTIRKNIEIVVKLSTDSWLDNVTIDSLTGNGTASKPYIINNVQDLAFVAKQIFLGTSGYATATYKIVDDAQINLNGHSWYPIGTSYVTLDGTAIYREFNGTFIGDNATISNLTIPAGNNIGLFGITGTNSDISSVILTDVNINGGYRVGGVVGYNNGTVQNSGVVGGSIKGYNREFETNEFKNAVGGVAGVNNGNMHQVYTQSVNISGYASSMGGIVGYNNQTLLNAYVRNGTVINSLNNTENENPNAATGGIIGRNAGSIKNVYIASNSKSKVVTTSIIASYENVISTYTGAIVGNVITGSAVTNAYYTENATNALFNKYGTQKTYEEMKTTDFVELLNVDTNVWLIDVTENDGLPIFKKVYSFSGTLTISNTGETYIVVTITSDNLNVRTIIAKGESIVLEDLMAGEFNISIKTQAGYKFTASVIEKDTANDTKSHESYRNISLGNQDSQFKNAQVNVTTEHNGSTGFYA